MANTIDSQLFYLRDKFAGGGSCPGSLQPGDFTVGSTTDDFGVGTKIELPVRHATTKALIGTATLRWLKYVKGTSTLAVAKDLCGVKISTLDPFTVSNYGSEIFLTGPIAVALGTLVDGSYYWFWTGGVCPIEYIAALTGNYVTVSSGVTAGNDMELAGTTAQPGFTVRTAVGDGAAFSMSADT